MRIRFNTTWEEDAEERRLFYAGISYGKRLKYLISAQKNLSFLGCHLQKHLI